MAWGQSYGGRAFRKERSAARRGEINRTALEERERPRHAGKRLRNDARKFAIEYRSRPGQIFWGFERYLNWTPYHGKYDTARNRDMAVEALNRKERYYEYRAVDL